MLKSFEKGLVVDATRVEADLCKDSFYDFVRRFWGTVEPADPVWNWHIEYLCGVLQEAAERVVRREPKLYDICVNVPPGSTKSLVCSVFFPAWLWTRMPSAKAICASYAHDLAMDLGRKSRDVVQSERWQRLFGDIDLREDQNAKSFFQNSHQGYRKCVGTNGSVTGFHGDIIVIDDPLDPNRANSEADLKTANRWIRETLRMRKVDKATTLTVLIMQRLHEEDPSGVWLEMAKQGRARLKHVCLPAEVTDLSLTTTSVRPRECVRYYRENGGLLDPVRIPRQVLEELRGELDDYTFAGQMLQSPTPASGGQFKTDKLLVGTPPKRVDFAALVRAWDKAGTAGGGAYTAGVLMGRAKDGRFWVLDVVRGQWDSATRERRILETADRDDEDVFGHEGVISMDGVPLLPYVEVGVEQEPGSGGKESAEGTLRRLAGRHVRIVRPTGDKELRADPYSVQVNGGNVSLARGPWNKPYSEELRNFPVGRFKDQVDASSLGFTLLTRPRTRVGGLRGVRQSGAGTILDRVPQRQDRLGRPQ